MSIKKLEFYAARSASVIKFIVKITDGVDVLVYRKYKSRNEEEDKPTYDKCVADIKAALQTANLAMPMRLPTLHEVIEGEYRNRFIELKEKAGKFEPTMHQIMLGDKQDEFIAAMVDRYGEAAAIKFAEKIKGYIADIHLKAEQREQALHDINVRIASGLAQAYRAGQQVKAPTKEIQNILDDMIKTGLG